MGSSSQPLLPGTWKARLSPDEGEILYEDVAMEYSIETSGL